MFGMCINKRVVGGLALTALVLLALAPRQVAGLVPLLVMAVCPLSMLWMMRGMHGRRAADATGAGDWQLREFEEEVNRLKAELALRDETPA